MSTQTVTNETDILNDTDILAKEKEQVTRLLGVRLMTAENAVFTRTPGGFLALEFEEETYPRIAVHRCFPFSEPTRYISIREPEGDGKEIGLIEDITTLPEEIQSLLAEQMELRYFTPHIRHIHDIKEEYGYSYWSVTTDRGRCRFTVRFGAGSVIPIGGGRYLVTDIDGNRFEIPNVDALTAKEMKKLDLFI